MEQKSFGEYFYVCGIAFSYSSHITLFADITPDTQLFDKNGQDSYGLQKAEVKDMNTLLIWAQQFYKDDCQKTTEDIAEARRKRMKKLLDNDDNMDKVIKIYCINPLESTINHLKPTIYELLKSEKNGKKSQKIAAKMVLLGNIGNVEKFTRTLMSMHICFGCCGGDIESILKIFLGRSNLVLKDGMSVGAVRSAITLSEQYYIDLVRKSFLQHIAKHWVYRTDNNGNVRTLNLADYSAAQHKKKSGFVLFSSPDLTGMTPEEYAVDVLLSNANLLKELKILKTSEGDLTISTEDGLRSGDNVVMFRVKSELFSESRIFGVCSLKVNDGTKEFDGKECFDLNKLMGKKNIPTGSVTLQKKNQQELKCFFKLTLPNNITPVNDVLKGGNSQYTPDYKPVPLGKNAVSNRVNNMGSFYVRNNP